MRFWTHCVRNERDSQRVLVTRSQPGAARLADVLERAGYSVTVRPIIGVEPNVADADIRAIRHLDRYDMAVFVSEHAVAYGFALIDRYWSDLPADIRWFAVGAATARALTAHGVVVRAPADERSEGILAMPDFAALDGARVLIVGGVGGRRQLDSALVERGAHVRRLEVYRRTALARDDTAEGFDFIVVSSVAGGEALAEWRARVGSVFDGAAIVVPSARVAQAVDSLGFGRVIVARGASPGAVLNAIRRYEEDHG